MSLQNVGSEHIYFCYWHVIVQNFIESIESSTFNATRNSYPQLDDTEKKKLILSR